MEPQVNSDHEQRIRYLERKVTELGFSINANGRQLDILVPKVDNLVQSDLLAQNIRNALKQNENEQWTKREKLMAIWTLIVTTVAPIATTLIVIHSSGK